MSLGVRVNPNAATRRAESALDRALSLKTGARPDDFEHPGFERLEALVDGRLDDADQEIVATHVEFCATCAQDLADLTAMRNELAGHTTVVAASSGQAGAGRWRLMQVAAAVIAVVGIGYFVVSRLQNSTSPATPASTQAQANAPVAPAPAPANPLTADEQSLVDRVLASGRLEMPAAVRGLSGPVGTLLGGGATASSLVPLSPIGTAVLSTAPEFTWQPMRGATSYSIAVFDQQFAQVASADHVTGTSWTPPAALPRGATLAWQITAHFPTGDVLAPAPPQPEARFVVVDDATAAVVTSQRARLADQPLALGVLLAKAGLFLDAQHAFERAATQPVHAEHARQLLAGLKR